MTGSFFLSLREGVSFTPHGVDQMVLQFGSWTSTFSRLSPGTRTAFERLGSTGDYEDRLTKIVLTSDGIEALATFYYYVGRLSHWCFLRRSVYLNGERFATLVPISRYFEYASRDVAPDRQYQLSRFAYMHVEEGEPVLESPLSHARMILHDARVATLVHILAKPRPAEESADQVAGLSAATDQLMTLLLNAHMLTELSESGKPSEDEDLSLRSWEFHDLLFHSRSRIGRHDRPVGATFRFAGQIEPPPALKAGISDKAIALYSPDLEKRKQEDPPFALVQETRCSVREYNKTPITVQQVGEFLYRVGRVTQRDEFEMQTPRGPIRMEFHRRPYPAGGALYELELYLTVNACGSLAAGLYHYDAGKHRLEHISGPTAHSEGLLLSASHSTEIPREHLQVLITITARFQRLSWKYASMSYAATLKHVGVLYQTMYLVATAMDLAPCAIGCGDSDLFARAIGTNYYDETSVGEFVLGTKPGQRG